MKLGSLFDGAGGFPFAGSLLGIEPVWASEIEKFPVAVTTKNFPNMEHLGDVTLVKGSEITPVDVITFGSPCQDLSVAGKQKGLSGERSGLFMEAVRIIKEMRDATNGRHPTFAVWENVPGAFSSSGGDDFRCVLEELCKIKDSNAVIPQPQEWADAGSILGDGYSVAWRVLDAQFWGVPQRRRRIFLVADFTGEGAEEILFVRNGLSRDFASFRESWQDPTAFAESGFGKAEFIDNHPADSRVTMSIDGNCQTLSARCGTGGGNTPMLLQEVYNIDRAAFNQGENAKYDIDIHEGGASSTVVARGPNAVCVKK